MEAKTLVWNRLYCWETFAYLISQLRQSEDAVHVFIFFSAFVF